VELTHASFFSGVGGLDLGLERAGWRTVSFSEIDPYASAVLAERWPGVPNLGDIVALAGDGHQSELGPPRLQQPKGGRLGHAATATLWSGGFPCQDLSVAGKRAGFAGERSSLAFAFLDLVERHRPPAILLENVPGLLSSNRGRDFGALLDRLAELGYWWAYRILDAQFFGVPQRRRRVFIVALHAGAGFGADSAAAVLSIGARCDGHSAAGDTPGEGAAERTAPSIAGTLTGPSPNRGWPGNFEADWAYTATAKFGEWVGGHQVGNLSARDYKSSNHLIGAPPDPGGVRAADGLAGRLDDFPDVASTLQRASSGGGGHRIDAEGAAGGHLIPVAPVSIGNDGTVPDMPEAEDRSRAFVLPLGLDSHRYRCCGNGVVSNVAEWIGVRLAEAMA
jgi:DNA (cytosine-5)-methyltransferase 1